MAFVDPSGLRYGNNSRIQNIVEFVYDVAGAFPISSLRAIFISNKAREMGVKYAEEYNLYEEDADGNFKLDDNGNRILQTWDNEADAYRHFSWNALMTDEIGPSNAKIIARNHEMVTYDKDITKDGLVLTFNLASLMDINNNLAGVDYAIAHPNTDKEVLFKLALKNGDLIINLDQAKKAYGLTDNNIFIQKNGDQEVQYVKFFIPKDDPTKAHFLKIDEKG